MTIESLLASGAIRTVGDILEQGEAAPPLAAFVLPRLGDYTPSFPEPGIYFDMDEDSYHAVPALSSSGIKAMASSPMLFWAKTPWLNPDYADDKDAAEKEFRTLGRAYHCRILEGKEAFDARFCIGLDKADYPDAIESTDDIKLAIANAGAMPVGRIGTGVFAANAKGSEKEVTRAPVKADWIAQLLELDPSAQIWPVITKAYAEEHAGKSFISAEAYKRLAIAAMMIERDEELSKAFTGGYPEVSLFWHCPKTSVPMKARVDYLKLKAMVDLKTTANQQEMSIERAIAREIAVRKYTIQPSVYFEGADEVRKLVREHGAKVVHGDEAQTAWALKWAKVQEPDQWCWIVQQKGIAPVTRGLFYPRGGTTKMITDDIVMTQKRRFLLCARLYDTSPWLDLAPIYDLADEDLPPWTSDI